MAIEIVRYSSEYSFSWDHDDHDSEVLANVNASNDPPMVSEPLQNTTMRVSVGPFPTEGDNLNNFTIPRDAIFIHAPGWIALLYLCWSRFIQSVTRNQVRIRLLQLESSSENDPEAPPDTEHARSAMDLEPFPITTVLEAHTVGLRTVEGDDINYINAFILMTTARVAVGIDAPRWVALRFIYLVELIQMLTGTRVEVWHGWIEGLEPIAGDLIPDAGSAA